VIYPLEKAIKNPFPSGGGPGWERTIDIAETMIKSVFCLALVGFGNGSIFVHYIQL
jgi:hypothetical protein